MQFVILLYEVDLALFFGIISMMLASIVIVEQQHLKRIIEHDKKDRTKKSAGLVSFNIFKLLIEIEELHMRETEKQEEIDKMTSDDDTPLETIEEYKNSQSGILTRIFEHVKKELMSKEISDMQQSLNLFRDDFDHELLHEINTELQQLKDWKFESRLINPRQITSRDIANPESIATHYNKLSEIYTKLSKLAGFEEN